MNNIRLLKSNRKYLYNFGNTCNAVTGGWNIPTFDTTGAEPVFRIDKISIIYKYGAAGLLCTNQAINLTNYCRLCNNITNAVQNHMGIGLTLLPNGYDTGEYTSYIKNSITNSSSIDISKFYGNFYITMYIYVQPDPGYSYLYSIWLE